MIIDYRDPRPLAVILLLFATSAGANAQEASPPKSQPAQADSSEPTAPPVASDEDRPWRLEAALDLPPWIDLTFEQRTRYESLDDRFRAGRRGSDQGLFLRNRVALTLKPGIPQATIELMDSRQEFADTGTAIGTSQVNAAELIQIFGALNLSDVFSEDDKLFIQGGRFTMDVGSRRLVARNRFRNTTNTFTGVNAVWTHNSGASIQGFWTLPIERLPSDRDSLLNNEVVFDEETLDVQFWGVVGTLPSAIGRTQIEGYVFGVHEDDGDRATRNRELYTIGTRFGPPPQAGAFDFEVESAVQFGTSSLSSSPSARVLDHLAFFQHAEIGYRFEGASKLRVALQFDYAGGDDDPNDDENNRFDTLFGARRFDFGPTGIFGPFNRSNLISPGYRFSFRPGEKWNIMFSHRFYWLADSSDAYVGSGLQDPTGDSGRFLGNMPELRVRWDAIPGNLRLEGGAAYLFKGDYFESVPGSPGTDDIAYLYFQTTLTF